MPRVFTNNIPESGYIGDSLSTINKNYLELDKECQRLDTNVDTVSAYTDTLKVATTVTLSSNNFNINNNLTITTNLTATNDIIARNNVRIFKTSTNSWISLGDKQLTHESWMFNDLGKHIMPLNRTKVDFYSTGALQTWVVPTGVNYIYAKLWGAGGAGGVQGFWTYAAHGGGGGHTRGLIPVTPGETLTILVGRGGILVPGANSSFGFGGGANSNGDNNYGGQGGGGTFIFRNYVAQTPQPGGIPLLVAGGGGSGGTSRTNHAVGGAGYVHNDGGAGGGRAGQKGNSPFDGKLTAGGNGGTQSAPGAGGTVTSGNNGIRGGGIYSGGVYTIASTNQYQGGAPGLNSYGGGGGGGYYGGGGGAYSESNTMGGGGGGSGYVNPSVIFGETFTGVGRGCPYSLDPDLIDASAVIMQHGFSSSLGFGGVYRGIGFDGYVAIYY